VSWSTEICLELHFNLNVCRNGAVKSATSLAAMSRKSMELSRKSVQHTRPAAPTVSGWLQKKGKRAHQLVKRYFKLTGSVLSNHRGETTPATWQVSILDARVKADYDKNTIYIDLYNSDMALIAQNRAECEMWADALKKAAKMKAREYADMASQMGAYQYVNGTYGGEEEEEEDMGGRRSVQLRRPPPART